MASADKFDRVMLGPGSQRVRGSAARAGIRQEGGDDREENHRRELRKRGRLRLMRWRVAVFATALLRLPSWVIYWML